jgi:hypothetical protein
MRDDDLSMTVVEQLLYEIEMYPASIGACIPQISTVIHLMGFNLHPKNPSRSKSPEAPLNNLYHAD